MLIWRKDGEYHFRTNMLIISLQREAIFTIILHITFLNNFFANNLITYNVPLPGEIFSQASGIT